MKKSIKKRVNCIKKIFLFFLVATFTIILINNTLSAQQTTSVSDIYIVTKGDSLWDISTRFFGNPFLWPALWQKNPHIKDPHWIYPGQIINLREIQLPGAPSPIALQTAPLEKEKKKTTERLPEIIAPSESTEPQYITSQDQIDSCSYLIPEQRVNQRSLTEGWKKIIDSKEEKTNLSYLDYIYIELGEGHIKPGQIFTIFTVERNLKCPSNSVIPYVMIRILGKAEIVEVYPEVSLAQIVKSYSEITVGDLVKPYEAMQRPFLTPISNKGHGLEGRIITSEKPIEYLSEFDIVFLDRGKPAGLEPGNSLEIYRFDTVRTGDTDSFQQKVIRPLGKIHVLKVEEETSTVQIAKSLQPIVLGDLVRISQE